MTFRLAFVQFLKPSSYVYCLFLSLSAGPLFSSEEGLSEYSRRKCIKCTECGTIPYPSNTGFITPDPIVDSPQVWSFVSEPNLHPMKITVNTFNPGTSPGLIFLAPYGFSDQPMYGQSGSLILDNEGTPVWFRPLSSPNLMNTVFRMQTFKGKPVLTFWQGTLITPPAYTNAPGGVVRAWFVLLHFGQHI